MAAPDLDKIKHDMLSRKFPILFDDLVARSSYILDVTLADYLRSTDIQPFSKPRIPDVTEAKTLPPAHHLVYFPPDMPDSMTLPDGTDPSQSPGKPFTRRMWAGGEVHFNNKLLLKLDGSRIACVESIVDLSVKGHPGAEKLFVRMERLIGRCEHSESEDSIRARFKSDSNISIKEIRSIFFSRPLKEEDKNKGPKPIKPESQPEFEHQLTPNAKLLFRYSALTFNTHAIHRDIAYCHNVEHYPDLIVHGPLSFTFLTTFLRHKLIKEKSNQLVKTVKYRNTHPVYNERTLKLCGRKKGENEYDIWEENDEGNVAVQYTAYLEAAPYGVDPANLYQDVHEYNLV